MTPATKTEPIRISIRRPGPVYAPSATANFRSPAPRLFSNQKGSNRANARPAPSSDSFIPLQPPRKVFAATPTTNPGTVSQFGIRRLRQSVHPAINESRIATTSKGSFKRTPPGALAGHSYPDKEKDPFV